MGDDPKKTIKDLVNIARQMMKDKDYRNAVQTWGKIETLSKSINWNEAVKQAIEEKDACMKLYEDALKKKSSDPEPVSVSRPVPVRDPSKEETVMVTCNKCSFLFSSKHDACPMCGARIVLSEESLMKAFMDYAVRLTLDIGKGDVKEFFAAFKKNNKRLPTLGELWEAATKLSGLEEKSQDEIQKLDDKRKEKSNLDLKAKMERMRDEKVREKEAQEAELHQIEEEKKQIEEEKRRIKVQAAQAAESQAKKPEKISFCSECGAKIPSDSNFCLECGAKVK